jgi:hypothetical protein
MKLFAPLGLPGAVAAGATLLAILLGQPPSAPEGAHWVRQLRSGANGASPPQQERPIAALSLATGGASANAIAGTPHRPTGQGEQHP